MSESLAHIDERFGHVAADMGLMTPVQVEEARRAMVRSRAEGETGGSLGEVAVRLGFITGEQLALLREEEFRRRRLITGYEIIDLIGSGTIATVYRAVQVAMDREVALKILHPRLATDPVFAKAYIAEAQAVSRFHHPHIVQGIDVGESNGFYYFAHEYLSGGSLGLQILKHGPLSENKALIHLRQTISALRHAWEAAVFHGDLNPGNLLLDSRGDIKLANLGVPRVARPKETRAGKRSGFVRCGPEYAAPEQLSQPELVNATTDIYSLGASFYHLSFGVPPFGSEDGDEGDDAVLASRGRRPVPSFDIDGVSRFSQKYVNLIRDMMESDPGRRPQDPGELARRLEVFHIAGAEEWSGLARQVSAPASPKGGSPGRFATVPPPSPDSLRRVSLSGRKTAAARRRGWRWIGIAFLAFAVLLLLQFVLGMAGWSADF